MNGQTRAGSKPYPYELMLENPSALDRLDVQFRWGDYGIRMLRFHHTSFPPGRTVQFHKHSDFEFHFIPRGKGKVILGSEPYSLHEGLMYLTGPGLLHYQEADASEAMDELCLHLDIRRLEGRPEAGGEDWGESWERQEAHACVRQLEQLPPRPVPDNFKAMECFLTAYRAWHENQPGVMTVIKQAIVQILLRVARAYDAPPQPLLPSRDMKHYRYGLAVQFIQDNYMAPLTLEVVAERVQVSPRQLQRIFRERTGGTFSEYIESVRLSRICSELAESDLTMDQLAVRCGFSSSNYLHYVFKRKLGTTPMQYRLQHREQRHPQSQSW
ncbi:AraC family transcriptional regulator [Paenibacillus mucilaginosus]|uniref:Transcriptional regulator, AraC family n=1 Tax=Paenibacillus mucilaginosus (strain KNP414) TaxID=1036673 RepID=F8FCI0_PAEMK|nr:AraC family transcriptional regulator [Paenibacillus mucilaginosus]AEI45299.1 transcriptional regulator, AraC family [Paenibacillus mucilaginosus KNP414]MCG7212817.1 AraC family transcriptional regulator [Paenibacillus mucilaginosus]WDM26759.1 AraC family transcriptional regulator [Paenibacillus mucilaginosus]